MYLLHQITQARHSNSINYYLKPDPYHYYCYYFQVLYHHLKAFNRQYHYLPRHWLYKFLIRSCFHQLDSLAIIIILAPRFAFNLVSKQDQAPHYIIFINWLIYRHLLITMHHSSVTKAIAPSIFSIVPSIPVSASPFLSFSASPPSFVSPFPFTSPTSLDVSVQFAFSAASSPPTMPASHAPPTSLATLAFPAPFASTIPVASPVLAATVAPVVFTVAYSPTRFATPSPITSSTCLDVSTLSRLASPALRASLVQPSRSLPASLVQSSPALLVSPTRPAYPATVHHLSPSTKISRYRIRRCVESYHWRLVRGQSTICWGFGCAFSARHLCRESKDSYFLTRWCSSRRRLSSRSSIDGGR